MINDNPQQLEKILEKLKTQPYIIKAYYSYDTGIVGANVLVLIEDIHRASNPVQKEFVETVNDIHVQAMKRIGVKALGPDNKAAVEIQFGDKKTLFLGVYDARYTVTDGVHLYGGTRYDIN
jgi:hypothetical protein